MVAFRTKTSTGTNCRTWPVGVEACPTLAGVLLALLKLRPPPNDMLGVRIRLVVQGGFVEEVLDCLTHEIWKMDAAAHVQDQD